MIGRLLTSTPHRRPSAPVARVTKPSDLPVIRTDGVGLAVWDRALPRGIDALIAAVDLSTVRTLRLPIAAHEVAILPSALSETGITGDAAQLLAEDIAGLVTLFAEVTGRPSLRLRLEAVLDRGCPKFHLDAVVLRLLCTYRGPGTEWLMPEEATAATYGGAIDPSRIRRLETGTVGIFKGSAHPPPVPNLLHRSPAAESGGRLLLALDL